MDNVLNVRMPNGEYMDITVVDTFTVSEYPNKQYIAYTLYEQAGSGYVNAYISILNEADDSYTLDEINDEEENEIIREAFDNLVEGEE